MTPITINIPHKLGKTEARRRIAEGLGPMKQQFFGGGMMKLEEAWEGDRLAFTARGMGQTVRGRMDVLEDAVKIEIDLPDFLAAIADKIRGRVQQQGALLLEDKRTPPPKA